MPVERFTEYCTQCGLHLSAVAKRDTQTICPRCGTRYVVIWEIPVAADASHAAGRWALLRPDAYGLTVESFFHLLNGQGAS